ncbi:MAG: hypothetical protein J6M41_08590 [Prevotella sp.]|nr:hypothetical protein [Prevotella sp.]
MPCGILARIVITCLTARYADFIYICVGSHVSATDTIGDIRLIPSAIALQSSAVHRVVIVIKF